MSCNSISIRSRGVAIIIEAIDCETDEALDISTSTSLELKISIGGANIKTETPVFLTDGLDGKMVLVLPLNTVYFEKTGNWDADVIVSYADGVFPATKSSKILVTS